MQREMRPDGLDLHSPPMQRRPSLRDRTPSFSGSAALPPLQISPEPAYIAPSAATQIVNSDYVSRGPNWVDNDSEDASGGLMVSSAALALVNAFLDQMLFNFLRGARSTSIVALKPAITDVLKPRLAKDAIQGADEELRGYLTGGDDEELNDFHNSQEFKGERNLERIFRTTRLRCMVYTRLGDMEEEDEEMYLEDEHVQDEGEERHRLSRDLGNVSPAAAIFLTSIVEFIGEQALMIAGEATFTRLGSKKPDSEDYQPMVEEGDVEKLAFNTTLGRLWRSWRSRVRPTSVLSPRSSIREMQIRKNSFAASDFASRATSVSEQDELALMDRGGRNSASVAEILHGEYDPASIPLPRSRGFLDEQDHSNLAGNRDTSESQVHRPRSMIEFGGPKEHVASEEEAEVETEEQSARPRHKRSTSLPLKTTPYTSPVSDTFATPSEGPDPFLHGSEGRANAEKELPRLTDDSQVVADVGNGNPAVSTLYDGVLAGANEAADPNQKSARETSLISDSSSRPGENAYDHDMTPQALSFKKADAAVENGAIGDRQSQASTVSSEYSFGGADPAAPTGIFGPRKNRIGGSTGDEAFPTRGDSLDVPNGDVENESAPAGATKNFTSLATVQGDRLRTYDESGKAVKRDIPVLYEDPSNQNVIFDPKAIAKTTKDQGSVVKPHNHSQNVPPLTPLRELRDAAQDTSDEASSVNPSDDLSRSEEFSAPSHYAKSYDGTRSETFTSVTSAPTPPVFATKTNDARKQPPAVDTGAERANVQRVTPTSASTYDSASQLGRDSPSSVKDARPVTGNSASSKLGKIIGRESGDSNRQITATRVSTDNNEKLPIRYSKTPRTGDKELDFENLIRSNETIQYTLTPQNMRDMEDPDSPRWSQEVRPSIASRAELDRTVSNEKANSPVAKPMKGMNGLRSNPTKASSPTEFTTPPKAAAVPTRTPSGPVPKSPHGRNGSMPRDTSIKDGSMRDFADFIRSTGPEADPKKVYKSSAAPENHSRNISASSQQPTQQAGLNRKTSFKRLTKQGQVIAPKQSEGSLPTRSSSKLRARDPIISSNDTTADLADFFRSTPPGGTSDSGSHFQRSVSGQPATHGLSNGRGIGSGTSIASTQDSFAPSKMTQSSTNSRTGLLESGNRAAAKSAVQRTDRSESGGFPVRKQRRMRDPYAIDSDEDDDGLDGPPIQDEESLSDFLRNYTPPPESNPSRDFSLTLSNPSATVAEPKTGKTGGTTMRERVARNIAVIPDYRPLPPKAPKKSSSSSKSPPRQQQQMPPGSNSMSYQQQQQQQQQQPPPQTYRDRPLAPPNGTGNGNAPQLPPLNAPTTSTSHPSTNGGPTYTGKQVPRSISGRPKPQARDETSNRNVGGGMSDLAEFLRDTEPPAPSGPLAAVNGSAGPSLEPKESRWGSFGRKRRN